MRQVVTLLTDFGVQDSYVAEMKAVLLAGIDNLQIVDITHAVPPFDVKRGAFQLFRSYSYFPPGTIHIAVVDPGVGSQRRGVYAKGKNYHFIGPDNGLLRWAVRDCELRDGDKVGRFEIPTPTDLLPTFHGRDLFAPFAIKVAHKKTTKLTAISELEGSEFPGWLELDGVQRGQIIGADQFGNVVTSIPYGETKKAELQIHQRTERIPSVKTYQDIEPDKVAIVRGSHGYWEVACRRASAWDRIKVKEGDEVTLYPLG